MGHPKLVNAKDGLLSPNNSLNNPNTENGSRN